MQNVTQDGSGGVAAIELAHLAQGSQNSCPPRPDPCSFNRQRPEIVYTRSMHFEWDARKDRVNRRKHGVAFEEARSVFSDVSALFMADPDHSQDEERFLLLGLSCHVRILLVVHCERSTVDGELVIRIISSRPATKSEERQYLGRAS